jgi:hypothetical protein
MTANPKWKYPFTPGPWEARRRTFEAIRTLLKLMRTIHADTADRYSRASIL